MTTRYRRPTQRFINTISECRDDGTNPALVVNVMLALAVGLAMNFGKSRDEVMTLFQAILEETAKRHES